MQEEKEEASWTHGHSPEAADGDRSASPMSTESTKREKGVAENRRL